MKRAGQVNGIVHLVEQPQKMINFIGEKITDVMEPSHPPFTNPYQPGKGVGPFPYNCDSGTRAHQKR